MKRNMRRYAFWMPEKLKNNILKVCSDQPECYVNVADFMRKAVYNELRRQEVEKSKVKA